MGDIVFQFLLRFEVIRKVLEVSAFFQPQYFCQLTQCIVFCLRTAAACDATGLVVRHCEPRAEPWVGIISILCRSFHFGVRTLARFFAGY